MIRIDKDAIFIVGDYRFDMNNYDAIFDDTIDHEARTSSFNS